ncbi:MAG TPA: transglutaminase domain-containing protein, partial [Thermomicrobiales bacterium]|nr:transglutaminase domain-containing protein [Thermomicrobiales bacterium]
FSLTGEFPSDDTVVASVESNQPHYLVARRYDVYDGRKWSTDIADTFRLPGESGDISVTKVIFAPGQAVALSPDIAGDRVPVSALITISEPRDGVVLTIETFSSSTAQVYAAMGWTKINQTFEVNQIDLGSVPIDLQALVASVKGAEYSIDPKTAEVVFQDPRVQAKFDAAREEKRAYPIKATLDVDGNNNLILAVSGRIPNYDDVEALFTRRAAAELSDYRVIGMESAASVQQLAQAGSDYPDWVIDRYLQVSPTVTERTIDLARKIVNDAGATNPYAMTLAIQNYLRNAYPYELNPPAAPKGQDAVDFFLFDHTSGRCTQYSSAMAVMLRSLGIPVRVATGFAYEATSQADQFLYRLSTAHAWPEVYFPGYGWIAFEPTPTQAVPDFATPEAEAVATEVESTPITDETTESTPEIQPTPTDLPEASPVPPQLAVEEDTGSGSGGMIALLFGITLLAGVVGLLALGWSSKTRGMTASAALLYRLQQVGGWFGMAPTESTTPAEYADTFARRFPGTGAAAHSISEAYYHEQFGPVEGREELIAGAERGWGQIRRTILRWRPWQRTRRGKV